MQDGGGFFVSFVPHDVGGRGKWPSRQFQEEEAPVCPVSAEPGARCRGGVSPVGRSPLPGAA